MVLENITRGTTVASQAKMADTFISRMVGLIGQKALSQDDALVITHCRSIHMMFMAFPIDVIFLDKGRKVVGLVQGIKPYRFSRIFPRAFYAAELAPGKIQSSQTQLGDILSF